MSENTVFGYAWVDIQRAQQRQGNLGKSVELSVSGKPEATIADLELLKTHGTIQAIRDAGLWGVADRLSRGVSA